MRSPVGCWPPQAAVRRIRATSVPPAASRCPAGTSCSCTAATSAAARRRQLPGETPTGLRRPSGARLRAGRPASGSRTRFSRPVTSGSGPRPALAVGRQALRLALIDAAPRSRPEEPVVGGPQAPAFHSEDPRSTRPILAGVLGFPLVESADSGGGATASCDAIVWGTLKRVDVVLRRVDSEFVDPLGPAVADSRLGVVGLGRGYCVAVAVTVVKHVGQRQSWKALGCFGFLCRRLGRAGCWVRTTAAADGAGVLGRHQHGALAPC